MSRLVRTVDRHIDVGGLVRGELGQLGPQLVQVQRRHLFI